MQYPEAGLSVTSNGKPRVRPFSWPGWAKRSWTKHLFGAGMYKRSVVGTGLGRWMYLQADTLVNRSVSPVNAVAQRMSDTYGPRLLASLAKRNPASVSSKTSPDTLGSALTLFGMTFGEWAIALRRDSLRRRKSARRTGVYGCSSSPWQTPKPLTGGSTSRSGTRKHELLLGGQVKHIKLWPTARGEDSESCGNHPQATDSLTGATKMWPTPNVPECGRETAESKAKRPDTGGINLQTSASLWPTLKSRDTKGQSQRGQHGQGDALPNMVESRSFRPDQATSTNGHVCSPKCRRLNPQFVEWLQGFPIGMTDCEASVMPWCRYKRRMRSCLFGLVS